MLRIIQANGMNRSAAMSYDDIRVYGHVEHVDSDACELSEEFDFTEFSCEDGDLELEYEGKFFFIDDFLERLENSLLPESKGRIDYIDQQAFTMTRFTIEQGAINRKKVDLNNVLERYNRE